jgi:hypothetical protein
VTRYDVRLVNGVEFAVGAVVAISWATVVGLETGTQRSVLAAITTVPLAGVFDDPAHLLTDASPTTMRRRWVVRCAIGASLALVTWSVALATAVPSSQPIRWLALEWATAAAAQLLVGATIARRHEHAGVGPGLITGVVWLVAGAVPQLHGRLHPIADHPVTWFAATVVLVAGTWVAGRDPAARHVV